MITTTVWNSEKIERFKGNRELDRIESIENVVIESDVQTWSQSRLGTPLVSKLNGNVGD